MMKQRKKLDDIYSKSRSNAILLVIVIFLGVLFLTALLSIGINPIENAISYTLKLSKGFQTSIINVVLNTKSLFLSIGKSEELLKENDRLKARINYLENQLKFLRSIDDENKYLREIIMGFESYIKESLIPVEVLGMDVSPGYKTLIFNKGIKDGIKKGMPVVVLDPETKQTYLYGKIEETFDYISKCVFLTNRICVVSAKALETGDEVVLKGVEDKYIEVKPMLSNFKIKAGNTVLTSGYSEIFPSNIPIGIISYKEIGGKNLIVLEPFAQFKNKFLFIVKNEKH